MSYFETLMTSATKSVNEHLNCVLGPTSYGPVIDAAVDIVERSGGQYHVLVIIADGQVTSWFLLKCITVIPNLSFISQL